jgi:hypothetical protein
VPYEAILADFRKMYPQWLKIRANGNHRDFAKET